MILWFIIKMGRVLFAKLKSPRHHHCWFPAMTTDDLISNTWSPHSPCTIPFKTKMSVGRLELPTNG